MPTVRRWLRDRRGITSIEYGMIAALVALGLIASVKSVGGNLNAVLAAVSDGLGGTGKNAPPPPVANGFRG